MDQVSINMGFQEFVIWTGKQQTDECNL